MKTAFTISQRVSSGFALLLAITLALGGFAAWKMQSAAAGADFLSRAVAPQAEITSRLAEASAQVQLAARTYGLTAASTQLDIANEHLKEVQTSLDDARKLATRESSLTALAQGVKNADAALKEYRTQFDATHANLTELAAIRTSLDATAAEFVSAIQKYIGSQDTKLAEEISAGTAPDKLEERRIKVGLGNDILDAGNAIRIANFKSQALRDSQFIERARAQFDVITAKLQQARSATRQEVNLAQLAAVQKAADAYHKDLDALIANSAEAQRIMAARSKAAEAFDDAVQSVLDRSITRTTEYATESAAGLNHTTWLVAGGIASAILVGIVASFLINRSLNRKLRDTSGGLTQGAMQIAAASGQVSSTSQSLAQGASEQAASLEEISSSLEELSSTTKHNAANADSAKTAADTARSTAEHGAAEMKKMEEAMAGIQQSSSDISKIIKTIDEIAFQTNILALNAAVEAARAGEAGAGFAVVADEVRNLAQRCAIAARETTEKISDAAQRSQQGAVLSTSVSSSLAEIVSKSREVDRLVAEVASASREQSAGLEQVNTAVAQMDKVTQSNAASAEEAASAAEELNAQSTEMRYAATELAALVGLRTESEQIEKPRAVASTSVKPTVRAHSSAPTHITRGTPAAASAAHDDIFR